MTTKFNIKRNLEVKNQRNKNDGMIEIFVKGAYFVSWQNYTLKDFVIIICSKILNRLFSRISTKYENKNETFDK